MKRNEVMALIATAILMFAVCLSASAKGKRNVERGMTKQEVIAIHFLLGHSPLHVSFSLS